MLVLKIIGVLAVLSCVFQVVGPAVLALNTERVIRSRTPPPGWRVATRRDRLRRYAGLGLMSNVGGFTMLVPGSRAALAVGLGRAYGAWGLVVFSFPASLFLVVLWSRLGLPVAVSVVTAVAAGIVALTGFWLAFGLGRRAKFAILACGVVDAAATRIAAGGRSLCPRCGAARMDHRPAFCAACTAAMAPHLLPPPEAGGGPLEAGLGHLADGDLLVIGGSDGAAAKLAKRQLELVNRRLAEVGCTTGVEGAWRDPSGDGVAWSCEWLALPASLGGARLRVAARTECEDGRVVAQWAIPLSIDEPQSACSARWKTAA